MPFIPRLFLCLSLLLSIAGRCQETVRFRQWIGGEETGGMEVRSSVEGLGRRVESREWLRLERLGLAVEQEVRQTLWRDSEGAIRIQWQLRLAQEPMEGEADWSPKSPLQVHLKPKGMPPQILPLPENTILWPEEADARMMAAAAKRSSLSLRGYVIPMQQASALDLECLGHDPLPGFPDAVRFKGRSKEGPITSDVEIWISPTRGELRHQGKVMGMDYLLQRAELPAPGSSSRAPRFFEQTLSTLPSHPLRLWLQDLTVTWKGDQPPTLPEDPQQTRLAPNRYRLRQAEPPSIQEAQNPPITGKPAPEDAPYLASSALVRLEDPVFDGLISRLNAPKGASRWDIAKRVTSFVFEWIREKDYSVGFASAQEVARNGRGDCTEHGALAIALLRRLGVPCRAVAGWAALENTLGLHFWVEVKLKDRWVPIDPTFDQAPASALRMKLGTSDMAELGSLGWETATTNLKNGAWQLDQPWPQGIRVQDERLQIGQGRILVAQGRTWIITNKELIISGSPTVQVEAALRPSQAQTRKAKRLMAPSGQKGWWASDTKVLWLEMGLGAWLRLGPVNEGQAVDMLGALSVQQPERSGF